MEQIEKKQKIEQLYQLIASLDSPEDCRALFDDLCTIKEIENITKKALLTRFRSEKKKKEANEKELIALIGEAKTRILLQALKGTNEA